MTTTIQTAVETANQVNEIESPQFPNNDNLENLTDKARQQHNGEFFGDFVHQSQDMAANQGFRNVSQLWINQTLTFEQAKNEICGQLTGTYDVKANLERFVPKLTEQFFPVVNTETNNSTMQQKISFGFLDQETGKFHEPTRIALDQLSKVLGLGSGNASIANRLINGDSQDREMLTELVTNQLRHVDLEKERFFRLRSDGTMRAFLGKNYSVVPQEWFLDTLEEIVPNGRISHLNGDGDTCYFNLLIPDSLRTETDSEYGGMLACGNSEIGQRAVATLPSVFRAICMNGCIWDQVEGVAYIRKKHIGITDLNLLKTQIADNLNRQIPLLNQGIDTMQSLKAIQSGNNASIKHHIAAICKLTTGQTSQPLAKKCVEFYSSQKTEENITAFDLLQSFTRAAQEFKGQEKETYEQIAGNEIMQWNDSDWATVFVRATKIKPAEFKTVYGAQYASQI